jgi:mRNA interferase MazF
VIGPPPWECYFRHREHAGIRPGIVLSIDRFNSGRSDLAIVVPVTSKFDPDRMMPYHVRLDPPEGGVNRESVALCENLRSVSRHFLLDKMGEVEERILQEIEIKLRDLLGFI